MFLIARFPREGNKSNRAYRSPSQSARIFFNEQQLLILGISNRHYHATALSQLADQGRRDMVERSSYRNGVIRCKLHPPLVAITVFDQNILITEPFEI